MVNPLRRFYRLINRETGEEVTLPPPEPGRHAIRHDGLSGDARLTPLTLSRNEPLPQVDYEMELQRIQREMLARLQGNNRLPEPGADEQADTLLLSFLDDGQKATWQAKRYFDITVQSGNRYRLTGGGVLRLNEQGGKTGEQFCLVPQDKSLPDGDRVLSRLLLLQADESLFLQKARRWGNAGCDGPVARTLPPNRPWNDRGEWGAAMPPARHANRLFRFTQRLDQIEERYNWGMPSNVRAIPERQIIVVDGQEYRIINQTIEQGPFPYFAHGTRTVTLEVEPADDYPVPWHEWRLGR